MAEKDRLVEFMNSNWGSSHPLINNDVFFGYYYADGDMTNFYISEKDGDIIAVCGYIPSSKKEDGDIWISIWLAKKGHNGAGLELMGKMKELTGASLVSCNNIRKETMPFYTFLGWQPGELLHRYRLRDLDEYVICDVTDRTIPACEPSGAELVLFESIRKVKEHFDRFGLSRPGKDLWHVERRYYSYPYYRYLVYGVRKDGSFPALAVFRVNEGSEGNVLRLVDYIGDPADFGLLSGCIDPLMEEFDCEYCDVYCRGVEPEKAGFKVRDERDPNVIPNYLDPLLKKNIDYYYFTSETEGFMMFKADGDQDRKNLG